ncbi:MAG: hypothetical protein KAT77_03110 [Nanoarchaeota archaeon]|nr:hypothetical protein [Nanoarchaeota archaeon]
MIIDDEYFFWEPLNQGSLRNEDLIARLRSEYKMVHSTEPGVVDRQMKSCCFSDNCDLIIYDTTGFCYGMDSSDRARIFQEHFNQFWGKALFLFLLDEDIFEGVRDMMDESMFYSARHPYKTNEVMEKIEEILS